LTQLVDRRNSNPLGIVMVFPDPVMPGSPSRMARRFGPALTLLLSLFLLASADAQQTTLNGKLLLEGVVDDYGPKYQDVDTAIEQLRGGRITEARESLATARRKNANLPPANLMLAQLLFRLQQGAAAQMALEEAVKEDPADPGAYVYLGEVALQSRRWTEAKMDYEKALELAPQYTANDKRKDRLIAGAYMGLSSIAEIQEDWPTARQHLEKVRQLDSKNALAMTRLGRVMFKMAKSREDEAAVYAVFKQIHAADPETTAHPDVNMALLYQQANKSANAKKLMERAAQTDSQNVRTMLQVGKWALDQGETEMADRAIQAAVKLEPNSINGWLLQAMVARQRNDLVAAEDALNRAHNLAPSNLAVLTQLAQVLAESTDERKQSQALEYARLGTQLFPDLKEPAGREAAVTLAWVLSRMKQDAAATRAIEQVLKSGDGRMSSDSAYHAAQILYNQGMTETARQLLETSLQSDPVFTNRGAAEQLLAKIRNR
jgi:tetratricopeptide (TPR) repeat protein